MDPTIKSIGNPQATGPVVGGIEAAMTTAGMDGTEHDGIADAGTGRHETRNEKRDRNWDDLLQELRVMQTGTQIIAGFLLTLPFQQRFTELDAFAVGLYLGLVVLAAGTTCLMLVPVAMHRELFGLRVKDRLVASGRRVVSVVLWLIGLLVMGTTALIFYLVLDGLAAALVAAAFGLALLLGLLIYPRRIRGSRARH
ncbi:DUF6328 family protein [Specibacter sp. NPDC078692]|uniref:DUF6328 family protein n=1 Tax=Specibacter sp. NPDC078692 TaxID=3155818 RepID=UPI003432DCD6